MTMTKLIDLTQYRATAERDTDESAVMARAASGATARILLFTGVRYERMDDATPMAAAGRA